MSASRGAAKPSCGADPAARLPSRGVSSVPAADSLMTASSLIDVRLPAAGMHGPSESAVPGPIMAIVAAARCHRSQRGDAADRAVKIVRLSAVEDHARQFRANVHQVPDRFLDKRPLLTAGNREN